MIQRDLVEGPRSHTIGSWASNQVSIALGNLMTCAAPFQSSLVCACGYRSTGDRYAALAKVRYDAAELIEHR